MASYVVALLLRISTGIHSDLAGQSGRRKEKSLHRPDQRMYESDLLLAS